MKEVTLSGTLKYVDKIREMKRTGADIINFDAMPDTPQHIKDAAREMLYSPAAASYTDPRGLAELREAIAEKLKDENKIEANPENQIMVTLGGKSAILTALLALVNPGDEIMIEDPVWVTYLPCIHLAGGTPVFVPLKEDEGWKLSPKEIERRITPKTKMIVICNPHNPTGRVLGKVDIEEIIEVIKRHDVLLFVDECYEKYVYDGLTHYSIASFPDMADRTITLQTTTKIFNMFGWRVGWVTASKDIIEQMLKIHSHSVTCAPSFAQAGAVAALTERPLIVLGGLTIQEMVKEWTRRRDAMVDGLNKIPGVTCVKGSGGYFTFPEFSAFGMSSMQLYERLLAEAGVSVTPGIEFGNEGEGHCRFLFSCPVEGIETGLNRVRTALAKSSK